jgi:hypothetical protein
MGMEKEESMDPRNFRTQLEQVLRQKNPAALRQFLVAQGQWPEDTSVDVEQAMWTMILGHPALAALHQEAHAWLVAHGRMDDAALLRGDQPQKEVRKAPAPGKKEPGQRVERKSGKAPGGDHTAGSDKKA